MDYFLFFMILAALMLAISIFAVIPSNLEYITWIFKHKYYVYKFGRMLNVPRFQLLMHDISKFRPSEFFAYRDTFYVPAATANDYPESEFSLEMREWMAGNTNAHRAHNFQRAWLLHLHRNKHHWQYWTLMEDVPQDSLYFAQATELLNKDFHICLEDSEHDCQPIHGEMSPFGPRYDFLMSLIGRANRRSPEALIMPPRYIREMVADWAGAGYANHRKIDLRQWYEQNRGNMVLHPTVRLDVETLIDQLDPHEYSQAVDQEHFVLGESGAEMFSFEDPDTRNIDV